MTPTTRSPWRFAAWAAALLALVAVALMATDHDPGDTPPDTLTDLFELDAASATSPAAPTLDWADGDNTATPYALCAWIGVRDDVLGIPGTTLVEWADFVYYGDHWVRCTVRVRAPTFVSCWHYMIDRDRAHLLSGTYHLDPTIPPC